MKPTKILINSLTLINFKGIRNLHLTFKEKETFISGDNATGKTTIMDAFMYCLFDKDSAGRKDFNLKTLNSDGSPIHYLNHEVHISLSVNDELITLKKVYKEKWTKPKGQTEQVFSGHETTYYFNEVPLAQKDYNAKIELICPEKVFKLLTNPLYFPYLNWTEQRSTLINIAGDVSDSYVARLNPSYQALLNQISGVKSLDEYKREIAMKKKRIKEDLEQIPARIDEVQRGLPDSQDWAAIAGSITDTQNRINVIDQKIADAGKGLEGENSKRLELQQKINLHKNSKSKIDQELATHVDNIKFGYDRRVRLYDQSLRDFMDTISQNTKRIEGLNFDIENLKSQREVKISAWHKINDEQLIFSVDDHCPTCGQELPEDFLSGKRAEAENKFNSDKAARLSANVSEGKLIVSRLKETEEKIETCKKTILSTEAELEQLKGQKVAEPDYEAEKKAFLETKKYDTLSELIPQLEQQLQDLGPVAIADTTNLQNSKKEMQIELDNLKKSLQARDQITSGNKRIEDLKTDQSRLSQELADFEKIEHTIAGFTKAKIEAIETKINSMFRIVKFKMYNQQINGGEVETCECTVEGVPYSDLNNAAKINAGMDILSTLSEKLGVNAPVFIDNREAVNKLLEVQSQVINLVVTKDKVLVFN